MMDLFSAPPARPTLRPYQRESVDSVVKGWESERSQLVVMPTGTGKTVVFAELAYRMNDHGRVLVLAHRDELIRQAASKLEACGVAAEIEKAEEVADACRFRQSGAVVASVQTLSRERRLKRFDPRSFSCIIIDEAHHAPASTYRTIIDHFAAKNPGIKVLGVTATPDRSDEAALGQVFGSVAYQYEILDAVNDGWLVRPVVDTVTVESLDFSSVKTTAGDLNAGELSQIMEFEQNLHEIAMPTLEKTGDLKSLIFCASVKHAERLAEILNRYKPESARLITGQSPEEERRRTLDDYSAGRFQYLCNVGVFTEGFDEPGIRVVVMARPTKSRSLLAQMVGRGTRPLPGIVDQHDTPEARRQAIAASEKPNLMILDFEGNAGRHKLVTMADVLGGRYSDDVVARAKKPKEGDNAAPQDVLERLEEEEREERARQKREREQRRLVRAKAATYSVKTVDPFDVLDIEPAVEHGWDRAIPLTDAQRGVLEKNGVPCDGLSKTKASRLIDEIFKRRNDGRCTYKQAKLLAKYGYATDVTFKEASSIINDIAANGWKRPADTEAVA